MTPDPVIQNELLSYLGLLPADDQARVVDFARTLAGAERPKERESSSKDLMRAFGTIGSDDAQQMNDAIEEGCEQIDASQW